MQSELLMLAVAAYIVKYDYIYIYRVEFLIVWFSCHD